MDEPLCFNNLNSINDIGQRNIEQDLFKKALEQTKAKFTNLIRNSDKYNDSNAIKKVFDNHMYISSFFKNKKIENINYIFNTKFSWEKNNYFNSNHVNKNKEDNFNDLTNVNINSNKERISNKNNNNNINRINNNTIDNKNNNTINDSLFTEKENNLFKKSNEHTLFISPNINVQNIIINHKDLDGISGNINTYNNIYENKMLLNINSNINVSNDNINLIGKKRNPDDKNEENDKIYNEIKELYSKYKNIKDKVMIYEGKEGFFEHNETIIIEEKPICIIYLFKNHINKIYLINEKSSTEDDKDIKEVLEKIKNRICNFMKNNYKGIQ